jgi:S1-C subfamily serine protease
LWPLAAGFVAALFGVLIYSLLFPAPIPLTQNEIDESIVNAMASATPPAAYSAQVYQAILPSLVLIKTQRENPQEEDGVGVGSGVVINASGDILTALHVVSDATEIETIFADGSRASAIIIATEPENDIAVLHPAQPPELIVPAILGNPNAMRIGDQTFAVGNPLGLTGSLSAGVISGFDRSYPINDSGQRLEGLIQFDAAVNPGNSGGPLLNRNGQVIGIVTALANPSEQNSFTGIGFAVPITTAGGAAGAPNY